MGNTKSQEGIVNCNMQEVQENQIIIYVILAIVVIIIILKINNHYKKYIKKNFVRTVNV